MTEDRISVTTEPNSPSSVAAPNPPPSRAPPSGPSAVALPAAPAGFTSLIVADFPALFAVFGRRRFTLLWRGSRDGFGARDFHGRCDGRAPTLTLIQDEKGDIFGGFTPVEWESREWNGKPGSENNCFKADPRLKSFLFPLKNPHNFPARKFALKAEKKDEVIWCDSRSGPFFGDDFGGIGVCDNCNTNISWNYLSSSYANDTGLAGRTVLTGSNFFTVKEIEVFEIADQPFL
jgi:hypothetical protein